VPRLAAPRRPLQRPRAGLAIIEMALVLPLLILVLAGIVQFGGMFFLKNEMLNLARDSARRLAVGKMTTTQVQPFVQNGFGGWPKTFTVTVKMPNPAVPAETDVVVTITVPQSEASLMDIFGMFQQGDLVTKVTMVKE